MTLFHLCPTGWELYGTWSEKLEKKAPRKEISEAYKAYMQHRLYCWQGCAKPTTAPKSAV